MKAYLLIISFVCCFLLALSTVTAFIGVIPFTEQKVPLSTSILVGGALFIALYSSLECLKEINETKN